MKTRNKFGLHLFPSMRLAKTWIPPIWAPWHRPHGWRRHYTGDMRSVTLLVYLRLYLYQIPYFAIVCNFNHIVMATKPFLAPLNLQWMIVITSWITIWILYKDMTQILRSLCYCRITSYYGQGSSKEEVCPSYHFAITHGGDYCCFQTSLQLLALPLRWRYFYKCASVTCRKGKNQVVSSALPINT